jgi:quinol monooxygenase YgiN
MIRLTGQLICANAQDLAIVAAHLPEHIRLTRAEAGCLRFDVVQTVDPLIWQVDETFTDQAAFDAHQTRTKSSLWYGVSAGIARQFKIERV